MYDFTFSETKLKLDRLKLISAQFKRTVKLHDFVLLHCKLVCQVLNLRGNYNFIWRSQHD